MKSLIFSVILLFLLACNQKTGPVKDPELYYTCSMDPQVVEYKPGKCPICKMELTPVKISKGNRRDELELSDQQILLGNIQTDTLATSRIGKKILLNATLNFDQRKINSVSSRIMGRIEKLYYKNLGDYVVSGKPLYELYSEELNTARLEYLQALENKNTYPKDGQINMDHLIQNAKNKLILWGMSERQISEWTILSNPLATTFLSPSSGYITELNVLEGDYAMAGSLIVKLADLSTLWAEAQIYSSQMADVNLKSKALVRFPDLYNRDVSGTIEFMTPELKADSRILLLRVSIPNPDHTLKPGMQAQILLTSPLDQVLTLPLEAVLKDSRGSTVWVRSGKNKFRPRMVQEGRESEGNLEILSGIAPGEEVVTRGAYLLNSEYLFKKGADPMASHTHDQ
ncbi:MAG TPA: efflux RND transporter periplasmic adaptor subunit [Saprospiraceae bacterium]|nr:efflux RND transporter periplasmic adaptor subunit [Saprospiraceae bacterium]HNT20640.1 efflux RND transporter periplasmic adaptor subunit [Saprospiraceae bacterium]